MSTQDPRDVLRAAGVAYTYIGPQEYAALKADGLDMTPYAADLALIKWWGNLSEPVSPDDAVYAAFYGSAANPAASEDERFLTTLESHDAAARNKPLSEDEYGSLFPPARH